jgi:hypothetical protein
MPENMTKEKSECNDNNNEISAQMYPETKIACWGRIAVIQEHEIMQGVCQHGYDIQNREKPEQEHGNAAPDELEPGEVEYKPGNAERDNGDHAYP